MTDSDVHTETWTAVPGYYAEVTDRGQVRSIDRTLANGRRVKGTLLAQRPSNRGYMLVDIYDYQGARQTRTVHTVMLLALIGPCPPGKQVRHLNDVSDDNRWPENLIYGTPRQNLDDRMRNSPAAPKPPPTLCAAHGAPVTRGSSTRCHECVRLLGMQAAELLRTGHTRAAAASGLGYSSPDGLYKLAVRYGGYIEPPAPAPRLSHRVRVTVRHWLRFGRGDAQ